MKRRAEQRGWSVRTCRAEYRLKSVLPLVKIKSFLQAGDMESSSAALEAVQQQLFLKGNEETAAADLFTMS